MKKYLTISAIIELLLRTAAYAEINSTSITSGITGANIENIKGIIVTAIFILGITVFLSVVYKFEKKIINKNKESKELIKDPGCFSCSGCIIVIIILILGIFSMPLPNIKISRPQARQKACYSNIRVIQGAVEMYNMDNTEFIKFLTLQNKNNLIWNGKDSYLNSFPKCPENGYSNGFSKVKNHYYSVGDLSATGQVICGLDPIGWKIGDDSKRNHGLIDADSDYENRVISPEEKAYLKQIEIDEKQGNEEKYNWSYNNKDYKKWKAAKDREYRIKLEKEKLEKEKKEEEKRKKEKEEKRKRLQIKRDEAEQEEKKWLEKEINQEQ